MITIEEFKDSISNILRRKKDDFSDIVAKIPPQNSNQEKSDESLNYDEFYNQMDEILCESVYLLLKHKNIKSILKILEDVFEGFISELKENESKPNQFSDYLNHFFNYKKNRESLKINGINIKTILKEYINVKDKLKQKLSRFNEELNIIYQENLSIQEIDNSEMYIWQRNGGATSNGKIISSEIQIRLTICLLEKLTRFGFISDYSIKCLLNFIKPYTLELYSNPEKINWLNTLDNLIYTTKLLIKREDSKYFLEIFDSTLSINDRYYYNSNLVLVSCFVKEGQSINKNSVASTKAKNNETNIKKHSRGILNSIVSEVKQLT